MNRLWHDVLRQLRGILQQRRLRVLELGNLIINGRLAQDEGWQQREDVKQKHLGAVV